MGIRLIITLLCGVGLYASLFMLGKSKRAGDGLLAEPSVVQTPRARLFFGTPNAALGVAYYPLAALAAWIVSPTDLLPVILVVACAAAVSLVLAYSLLFVTKMPCAYCWTSHGINWILLLLFWLLRH